MTESSLQQFFEWFPNRLVAQAIFDIIEGERVDLHLEGNYIGLAYGIQESRREEFRRRPLVESYDHTLDQVLEALTQYSLVRSVKGVLPGILATNSYALRKLLEKPWDLDARVEDSARATAGFYTFVDGEIGIPPWKEGKDPDPCQNCGKSHGEGTPGKGFSPSVEPAGFRGELKPEEVHQAAEALRQEAEKLKEHLEQQGVSVSMKDAQRAVRKKEEGQTMGEVAAQLAAAQGKQTQGVAGQGVVDYSFQDSQGRSIVQSCRLAGRAPTNDQGAERIQQRVGPSVRRIQRIFERLRPQGLIRERRQEDGDELDLDAYLDSYAEWKATGYFDPRIYIQSDRKQRDVFAGLVLDASGSTGGGILRCEQEAAFALTAALEKVGDDYCGYAFSGDNIYSLKEPNELFTSKVRARIAGLLSGGGTPLAVVVKHATQKVLQSNAHTKLLFVLTDGYPGNPELTQQAFIDARKKGVHAYLLAVEGLPQTDAASLAGEGNYFMFNSAETLAARLPKIYKRLTT